MTEFLDARNPFTVGEITPRRHVDSPRLWLGVLSGSIAIHLLLLLLALPLLVRIVQGSLKPSAQNDVPVELVQLPPEGIEAEPSFNPTGENPVRPPADDPALASNGMASAAPPQPFLPPAQPFQDDRPLEPALQEPFSDDPAIAPPPQGETRPLEQLQPVEEPAEEPAEGPVEEPWNTLPTQPRTEPSQGETDEIEPRRNPQLPPVPPADSSPPLADPIPLPTPEFGGNLPESGDPIASNPAPDTGDLGQIDNPGTIPAPNGDGEVDGTLPEVGVSDRPQATSYIVTMGVDPLPPNEATDIAEQPATPQTVRQDFTYNPAGGNAGLSSCEVGPEVVPALGQTVAMQVVVDATGQVVETVLRPESAGVGEPYATLAQCLVRQWKFNPASNQGVPVADSNLVVSIQVNLR